MYQIPKWIDYISRYFSLYNFHTRSSKKKSFCILTLCIQIFSAAWCTSIVFDSITELTYLMRGLDVLNFIIYYMNYSLTYWLIIYESFKHRANLQHFWHIFHQINYQHFSEAELKSRSYLIILIVTPLLDLGWIAFAICNERASAVVQKIMMFIFMNVSVNRLLFYILHLKMIAFQLQKIEIELKTIRTSCQWNFKIECNEIIGRFKWIRYYYGLIYQMSVLVNSIFGWSQLTFILLNCHCSVTYLNFFYRQMNRNFFGFNYGSQFKFQKKKN